MGGILKRELNVYCDDTNDSMQIAATVLLEIYNICINTAYSIRLNPTKGGK